MIEALLNSINDNLCMAGLNEIAHLDREALAADPRVDDIFALLLLLSASNSPASRDEVIAFWRGLFPDKGAIPVISWETLTPIQQEILAEWGSGKTKGSYELTE